MNTTDQTTDTTTETWTDEAGVTYTAVNTTTSTLRITATVGADGNWTYDEGLVSSYTTETTADGVQGSVSATGSFSYTFQAFSTSAVYSFTFNAGGQDNLSGNLTDTWSEIESGVLEEGTSTLVWVAAAQFAVVIQSTTQRADGSIAGSSSGNGTASSSSSSTLKVTRTSGAASGSSSGSASSSGSGSASGGSAGTTTGWTFTHSSQGTGSSNESWSYATTVAKSADGTVSASGSASGSASYAADETFTESYSEQKTNGTVSLDLHRLSFLHCPGKKTPMMTRN